MNLPKIIGELVILLVLAGWLTMWGVVAWLNYSLGDLLGATLTVVVFIAFAAGILLWRLNHLRPSVSTT